MLTPTLFFQLIITIIAAFQIFDTAFTVGRGGSDSLLFYLVYMWQVGFRDGQLGYGAGLSLVLFAVGATWSWFCSARQTVGSSTTTLRSRHGT